MTDERRILAELAQVLEARRGADPDSSYVASLYARGLDTILRKLSEETTETLLAARDGDPAALVHEIADLWFHSLVLLVSQGLRPEDVLEELQRRAGVSGLAEKAARSGD